MITAARYSWWQDFRDGFAAWATVRADTNTWIQPKDPMTPLRNGSAPGKVSSDNASEAPELQKILLRRRATALGLSTLLFLATLLWTASYKIRPLHETFPASAGQRPRLQTGINPNIARWFELAQLPGIGETLAKRMEDFRWRNRSQDHPTEPVFRVPADLAQVKGIGEKTVRRMRPFLRFPDSAAQR